MSSVGQESFYILRSHCQTLDLPEDATEFVMLMWTMIQRFDDMVDEPEKMTRSDKDALIWDSLVTLPTNAFYLRNVGALSSAVVLMIAKWKASDTAEREKRHDARSFVWRAGFYDVFLLVYILCKGPVQGLEAAETVLSLYGETLDDYMREFD